jgi:single-strand DNA-binding protein
MGSLNQIFLMGNVTRDPQVRQLNNNQPVATIGLAVNRHYKDSDGTDREETCFVDCTAFGKLADLVAKYVRKGKPLLVQGRLKFDSWDDPAGQRRTRYSVVIEQLQFTGSRQDESHAVAGGSGSEPNRATTTAPAIEQSEIPF